MKNIAQSSLSETVLNHHDKAPNPFILALMLTSLLYFTVGQQLRQAREPVAQTTDSLKVATFSTENLALDENFKATNFSVARMSMVENYPLFAGDRCVANLNLSDFTSELDLPDELKKELLKTETENNLIDEIEQKLTLPNSLAITH